MRAFPNARLAGLAALALGAGVAAWPGAGTAATPLRLSVAPETVRPGGSATVRLRGAPGATCTLTVRFDRPGAPVKQRRRIRGSLRLAVGAREAPGARLVRVRCGRRSASAGFTVVPPRSGAAPFTGPRLLFAADGAISSVPLSDPRAAAVHVAQPGATIMGLDASPARLVWTRVLGRRNGVFTSALDGSGRRLVYDAGDTIPTSGVLVGSAYFWLQDGAIARADLDTGAVDPAFIALPPSSFDGIGPAEALASDGRWLYFASCANDAIGRVDLAGKGLDGQFVKVGDCVQDVAVTSTYIYWPNLDAGAGRSGSLGRAAIDGTRVQRVWVRPRGGGELGNWGVAADATHVYWTSSDSRASGGTGYVGRVRADGRDPRPRLVSRGELGITISIAP